MKNFPPYPPRPHSSGQARITIAKRDYYLGVHGSTESYAEYARLLKEWQGAGGAASALLPAPKSPARVLTVAELVARWIEHEREGRGLKHVEVVGILRATIPLDRLFGATPVGEFTAKRLESLQTAMVTGSWVNDQERATFKPWSRNYVNRQIDRVIRVFRWGEVQGLVPMGTLEHLRTLEPVKANDRRAHHTKPRTACDWDAQVVPCLPHMPATVAAMVEVQYLIGCRPGEVVGMRAGQIDKNGPNGCWLFRPKHKNEWRGLELVKAIGPRAQVILAPYLLRCAGPDSPLFPPSRDRRDDCYTQDGYSRAVTRAVKKAGVKSWCAYEIRHAAKRQAMREFGLDGARAFLGQTALQTTAGYDAAVDVEIAARVAAKIG